MERMNRAFWSLEDDDDELYLSVNVFSITILIVDTLTKIWF